MGNYKSKTKNIKERQGFTLLELLAVLVILSALATIAIPIFINRSGKAKQIAHNENVRVLTEQAQNYVLSLNTVPTGDITQDLIEKGYIKELPKNPVYPASPTKQYRVSVNTNGTVVVTPNQMQVTETIQPLTKINIDEGRYIKFGTYLGQPIIWRVIHKVTAQDLTDNPNSGLHEGDLLLFADRIITFKCFDAKDANEEIANRKASGSTYWPNSNIREWLNSDRKNVDYTTQAPNAANVSDGVNPYDTEAGFLTNFTAYERNQIIPVTHKSIVSEIDPRDGGMAGYMPVTVTGPDAIATSNYDLAYYKNSTDKVFLLNLKELSMYVDGVFTYPSTATKYHIAYSTQQALDQNNYSEKPSNIATACSYLTRDAFLSIVHLVQIIFTNGDISTFHFAYNGGAGIRPALYISSEGVTINGATGLDPDNAYTLIYE